MTYMTHSLPLYTHLTEDITRQIAVITAATQTKNTDEAQVMRELEDDLSYFLYR